MVKPTRMIHIVRRISEENPSRCNEGTELVSKPCLLSSKRQSKPDGTGTRISRLQQNVPFFFRLGRVSCALSFCIAHVMLWAVVLFSGEAVATVRMPSIFSNHMVLQRGKVVPVWGWAKAGEKVTLRFAGQKHVVRATKAGSWRVMLRPLKTGASRSMTIQGAKNRIVLKDILVGEVWLCSGQSNMQVSMVRTLHGPRLLKTINNPSIRMFSVSLAKSRTPQSHCSGGWIAAKPRSVRYFSAVCFYFGHYLQKKLGVPVGLIRSAVGGTRAESWTPRDVLASSPRLRWVLSAQRSWERKRRRMYSYYLRLYMRWRQARRRARLHRRRAPARPRRPGPAWHRNSPAASYNGMIAPILTYGLRGVVWYQGESNIGRHAQYRHLMTKLIGSWRKRWKQGDFPFLFVQIAPFRYKHRPPDLYNKLCEAQVETWRKVPHTAMVCTHDITNLSDIHPRRKREVGRRLYLAALAKAYGQKVQFSGPIYRSMKRRGHRLILSFDHVGKGLVMRGKTLKQFIIAGKNRKFYPAQAKIVGKTVEVWSPKVKKPVAARLAWREDAIHNLFNQAGFPASTFRTDRWTYTTK